MIYQKDWLMRQIEEMIHALLAIAAGGDLDSRVTVQLQTPDAERITRMLDDGGICAAENLIYEHLDGIDRQWLQIAIEFYSRLNECSDAYLMEHDFSREEIADGLQYLRDRYGYGFLF